MCVYRLDSRVGSLAAALIEVEQQVYISGNSLVNTDRPAENMVGPVGFMRNGKLHLNDFGLELFKRKAQEK